MKNKIILTVIALTCSFLLFGNHVEAADPVYDPPVALNNDGTPTTSEVAISYTVTSFLVCSTPKNLILGNPTSGDPETWKVKSNYRIGLMGSISNDQKINIKTNRLDIRLKGSNQANDSEGWFRSFMFPKDQDINVPAGSINTTKFSFFDGAFYSEFDRRVGKYSGSTTINISIVPIL